ncbi:MULTISPECIES: hypothetical protein [Lysinibacillus]|uniref:hypothetical protein n=1 Tax=Lysinibacillus TaxID=400634 RepID=UPI0021A36DB1|nr:hypothetical protein [Lysinibacillus capsici]MCT1539489.1 hypothetical protein [Lysinibacillus capsici]MCT1570444.1 hypothetical protein [Lysinibacillus capsici]MCT1647648.1 hypothetical protein [Lysinibacillus capsici]MCT1726073.1 hypothetical protein [Lysinibacillus capsici]MCT1783178.1 hypothetical protein [Lysinibacillus capsici]
MTVNIESPVLEKLAQYKKNLEERENEVFALIDYNEGEITHLETELEQADARHILEYSEETKAARNNILLQIQERRDELQQHYRFIAHLKRRESMYLELTAEEEKDLVNNLEGVTFTTHQKMIEFEKATKILFETYNEFINAYNQTLGSLDSAASLIKSVLGDRKAKLLLNKVDKSYNGSVSRVLNEIRTEIRDPNEYIAKSIEI